MTTNVCLQNWHRKHKTGKLGHPVHDTPIHPYCPSILMSVINNVTKTIFYWNRGIVFKTNWKIGNAVS